MRCTCSSARAHARHTGATRRCRPGGRHGSNGRAGADRQLGSGLARCVARGAGVGVPHPPSVDELTDALTRVLEEPAYRSAAQRIAEHVDTEDGAVVANDGIEGTLRATS